MRVGQESWVTCPGAQGEAGEQSRDRGCGVGDRGPGTKDQGTHVTPLCCLLRGGRKLQGERTPVSLQALWGETWTNKQTLPQESLAPWTAPEEATAQFPRLGCPGRYQGKVGSSQPPRDCNRPEQKKSGSH